MKNGNQPIHPTLIVDTDGNTTKVEGLTKREHFACEAMNALLSKYALNGPSDQNTVAKMAVQMADSLLEELEVSNDK